MNNIAFLGPGRLCAVGLLLLLAGGCAALRQSKSPQPSFYSLDGAGSVATAAAVAAPASGPTLIVNPPQAAAGFDSSRIIYVRQHHKLEYFAHSEWVDSPARMLAPLIVVAIENNGTFRAVVQTPSAAVGDLRLDSEIVRLQQDFSSVPGSVRFTLRAYIVDNTTRRVIAWREFDEMVATWSEDPPGGVIAANLAVQAALQQLADFCTEAAGKPRPGPGPEPADPH